MRQLSLRLGVAIRLCVLDSARSGTQNLKKTQNFLFAALYEFRVPESIESGSVVGVVRALDADIGENAEMDYRIIGSDSPGMFDITTNRSTQDGVIVLRKVRPLSSLAVVVFIP